MQTVSMYIREPKTKRPFGLLVAEINQDEVTMAHSLCMPIDTFKKKEARILAFGRLQEAKNKKKSVTISSVKDVKKFTETLDPILLKKLNHHKKEIAYRVGQEIAYSLVKNSSVELKELDSLFSTDEVIERFFKILNAVSKKDIEINNQSKELPAVAN